MGLFRLGLWVTMIVMFALDLRAPASAVLLLLALIEGTYLWSRAGLWRLTGRVRVVPDRLSPGEDARLEVELENRKPWPVFLEWRQMLPEGLVLAEGEALGSPLGEGKTMAHGGVTLPWYGRERVEIALRARRRGCFALVPPRVLSRDVLGFHRREKRLDIAGNWVMVYPRLGPPADSVPTAAHLLGEQADRRVLVRDPSRVMGLREYTPDTPSRLIDWKASARHDCLKVKVLEPAASLVVVVAVDLASYTKDRSDEEGFEDALSLAAFYADWASDRRLPCGLVVNGTQVGREGPVIIPPSRGTGHLAIMMEALARLQFVPCGKLGELMAVAGIAWGQASLVLLHGGDEPAVTLPSGCRYWVAIHCAGGPAGEVVGNRHNGKDGEG